MQPRRCLNCKSQRYPAKVGGFCKKCIYWAKVVAQQTDDEDTRTDLSARLRLKVKRAQKYLDEYKWRERPFIDQYIDPVHLEYTIKGISVVCRSKLPFPVHSTLTTMAMEERLFLYEVLLGIIENIPCRTPFLHSEIQQ